MNAGNTIHSNATKAESTAQLLSQINFSMSEKTQNIDRLQDGFASVVGMIGGIGQFMFVVLMMMFSKFSEHNFIIKALQKLYLVRTRDQDFLMVPQSKHAWSKKKKSDKVAKMLDEQERDLLKINKVIKFSFCQTFQLFFMRLLCLCQSGRRDSKQWRLYEEGQECLKRDFNLVKIIKHIRNASMLAKSAFKGKETQKFRLKNSGRNVISIDSDATEEEAILSQIDEQEDESELETTP